MHFAFLWPARVSCPPPSGWQAVVPCVTAPMSLWLSGVTFPRQIPLGTRLKVPLSPALSPRQVCAPQTGVCTPHCTGGFVGSAQGSSCVCRDWEEVGAPYLCNPTSGGVCGLGREAAGSFHSPGSLSSSVPGPQPPCLHPCLLMGPIGPRQEGLQVPLIALSPAGQPQTLSEDVVTALNYNVCCFSLPIIDI